MAETIAGPEDAEVAVDPNFAGLEEEDEEEDGGVLGKGVLGDGVLDLGIWGKRNNNT